MPWWTWVSGGIFLAAVGAAGGFAIFAYVRLSPLVEGLEGMATRLDGLARSAEELALRLDGLEERSQEVERHVRRLQGSLARLSVLTWALGDARKDLSRLTGTYLSK